KEALSVLTASDEVIFVTNPLMPAVNDVLKCREVIKRLNLKIDGIVLNMVRNEKYELTEEQIERITGLPIIASLPFDKEILNGLSNKTPIVQYRPNSNSSMICSRLASNLLGMPLEPEKNVLSGFYDAFKKLGNFREASRMDVQDYSGDIKTDADKILDIVKAQGSIKISELANRLNISKDETRSLGKTLVEHGLVEFHSPLFRETRLRVKG
ncbi:MAG TPA: AAA family ATPase, partial [archaeon]|nr:AAA family ATPase [archaeon]